MSEADATTRLFTVEEANDLLPAIRADVEELLEIFKQIRAEVETAASESGLPIGSADLPKRLEARGIAPKLFDAVRSIIARIHARGCLVNGPEAGLIDFPCLYDNEIVFLCWKHGEPRVSHWHRIPDGFAGRRPLLDASESGTAVH